MYCFVLAGAEEENVHSLGFLFERRGLKHEALNRELSVPRGREHVLKEGFYESLGIVKKIYINAIVKKL